jgi:hypothetical protein
MRIALPPKKKIRKYQTGGTVTAPSTSTASSGAATGTSTTSYANMMSGLYGSLGGSRGSPFASVDQGSNPYFKKGGKVGAKRKRRNAR